jgi:hypothetical protein
MRIYKAAVGPTTSQGNLMADSAYTLSESGSLTFTGIEQQVALNQSGFDANTSLATAGSVRGSRSYVTVTGASGTVTAASAYNVDVRNLGAGTLTGAVGYHAGFFANSGGGTLTNAYGFYASAFSAATNNFGFYSDLTAAAGRWSFYANGTAPNYFAGDVRTGTVVSRNTTPVNSNDTVTTATASSLIGGIRTTTTAALSALNLPTGTNMDAAFTSLQVGQTFEWSLVSTVFSTDDIIVLANTGHDLVGGDTVKPGTSGRFATRKAGTNSFVTYRIA